MSALARDLRGDFLVHFGLVTARISALLRTGVEREPELLEFVFASLARMCKWLQRQLAAGGAYNLTCFGFTSAQLQLDSSISEL